MVRVRRIYARRVSVGRIVGVVREGGREGEAEDKEGQKRLVLYM